MFHSSISKRTIDVIEYFKGMYDHKIPYSKQNITPIGPQDLVVHGLSASDLSPDVTQLESPPTVISAHV